MKSFLKHSNLEVNFIFLLSLTILIAGCSEEKEEKDYLARVNDSYLTREELSSLADTSNLNESEINALVKSWINDELLFQKALEEEITEQDIFNNILQSSYKKLAIGLLIKKLTDEYEVDYKTSDLIAYYEKNKNYFQKADETYLINQAKFKDEVTAIRFREIALESNWEKAKQFFENNPSVIFIESGNLKELNEIYPVEVSDAVRYMFPDEISIVIRDRQITYNVVQLLRKFKSFEVFPFEIIRNDVEKRFIAEEKSKYLENFLKDLYSKSKIEIKERY